MMMIMDSMLKIIVIMVTIDTRYDQYDKELMMMMRRRVDYVKQCEQAGGLRVGTCASWDLHSLLCQAALLYILTTLHSTLLVGRNHTLLYSAVYSSW